MRNKSPQLPVRTARGFTLLEVIVSLTITGFVLGGLFTLVAGSKQLTLRAQDNLTRAMEIRAATNFALLQNEYNEVEFILENDNYESEPVELLEYPEAKTQPSQYALQEYEIFHQDREEFIRGTRWIRLLEPR